MTRQEQEVFVVPRPRIAGLAKEPGAERPQLEIKNWEITNADAIYTLEWLTWPLWLQKPLERIRKIAGDQIKRETHFVIEATTERPKSHDIVASMSTTRTAWNGDPRKVERWDGYAGGSVTESDYPNYDPNGNTFVIMSSSVDPEYQGQGAVRQLFEEMKRKARELKIEHIIGPFRPSGYGRYKREQFKQGKEILGFEDYCESVITNASKDPPLSDPRFQDPWLQAAMHMGMKPLRVDGRLRIEEQSMKVTVGIGQFNEYRKYYKHDKWFQMPDGTWECDETGSWKISKDGTQAIYTEPNLMGEIPLEQPVVKAT